MAMNSREIFGYVTALKGAGLAKLCGFVQGIPELSFITPYLLWGIPVGIVMAVLGLWIAAQSEEVSTA